ncbi:MAG: NUMOD4 motif-containing HNH endonuclease [Clostridiales bacterium]|nr:NUMOD4 motif-containing HNH endonuclease [Clostridiales bacterium]
MKAYTPTNQGPDWWRDIPGYGGKYQANRLGEIRRVFPSGLVRDMTPYKKTGAKHQKILRNRLFMKLTLDGKAKEVPVLKIMAATWRGPTPAGKVPYHINGIVTDNRAENIGFIGKCELGQKTGHRANKRKAVFKVNEQGEDVEVYRSAGTGDEVDP